MKTNILNVIYNNIVSFVTSYLEAMNEAGEMEYTDNSYSIYYNDINNL